MTLPAETRARRLLWLTEDDRCERAITAAQSKSSIEMRCAYRDAIDTAREEREIAWERADKAEAECAALAIDRDDARCTDCGGPVRAAEIRDAVARAEKAEASILEVFDRIEARAKEELHKSAERAKKGGGVVGPETFAYAYCVLEDLLAAMTAESLTSLSNKARARILTEASTLCFTTANAIDLNKGGPLDLAEFQARTNLGHKLLWLAKEAETNNGSQVPDPSKDQR